MPTRPLGPSVIAKVIDALNAGKSQRAIGAEFGISQGAVANVALKFQDKLRIPEYRGKPRPEVNIKDSPVEPLQHNEIRKLLKKGPLTIAEIADALDCGPSRIKAVLGEMKASGAMLLEMDGRYDLGDSILIPPGVAEQPKETAREGGWRYFGVLGDNHLCNKHARLDVLNAAYDHYEREGITDVYNTGNWIDGEARFNKTELLTPPGMDNQLDYMIDKYPQRKEITTHYIAGDDHEGWYQQREGVEIGRYLQLRAEKAGRFDLKYLGYGECDVKLRYGNGSSCMRVVHPGGGSAYAISYTDQKRVESYQGGEKPQVELVGHYHKFNLGYPREVHTVQTGCTCDQTMFMRKKRLQAHVGFLTVKLQQEPEKGTIQRFSAEWFPFFDRGYYEHRF